MIRIPAPKTITVGGKTFEVVQTDHLMLREGYQGTCCFSDLRIELEQGLCPTNKTETLLHESIEAINKAWLAGNLGHDDIDRLGEALLQLLQSLGIEIDW